MLLEQNTELLLRINLDCYQKENGNFIGSNPTREEEHKITIWLDKIRFEHPKSRELFFRKVSTGLPLISPSLSSKINSLYQYHCPICMHSGVDMNAMFPQFVIPIRISAISGQSSKARIKKAFKNAIKHRLQRHESIPFKLNQKLCVHIVFVMGKNSRNKDVDNMTKPLLDALQGILFENDRDIDHLSVLKIRIDDDEDYTILNIAPTFVNNHDDVIPSLHHGWAGAEFLDLQTFMS
jgi:Holliday junction resolvase RusA-like endonuclease